jgi:hypothetical protein
MGSLRGTRCTSGRSSSVLLVSDEGQGHAPTSVTMTNRRLQTDVPLCGPPLDRSIMRLNDEVDPASAAGRAAWIGGTGGGRCAMRLDGARVSRMPTKTVGRFCWNYGELLVKKNAHQPRA